ncbi:uncharacterized protein VP01_28g6 [Puccinia sorghi]|uniref:Uncharacterized protein n=1 Tax=Puccinia sorghi TaxID=27349 RepID=A0A0L6V3C5_9BASI|nr:uncharacterized protein VP01_28g6 [Puccinia sorghi]
MNQTFNHSKFDFDNFSTWHWGIITALGYKNVDDYILEEHTADMKCSPQLGEHMVPKITKYETKVLWDSIVTYFATKTVEKSESALEKLFHAQFLEGDMDKCINTFRIAFRRVVERLPPLFSFFRKLQFTNFKDSEINFDEFLKNLELQLQCQNRTQGQLALTVYLAYSASSKGAPKKHSQKGQPRASLSSNICVNNLCRLQEEESCLPEFGILSSENHNKDTIILDGGASANGNLISIVGFGPATMPTTVGLVNISLVYYLPNISDSLISLTH